jgi:general secretion pathway protein N
MRPNTRLLILGLIAFLVFLVISVPATVMTGLIAGRAPVEFSGVTGTLWHGQAMQVTGRDVVVGPLEWTIRPWSLLRGELAADVVIHSSTDRDQIAGSVWLGLAIPGVAKIRNANITADAEWVFTQAAVPIAARGRILIHIEELIARRDRLPKINATLSWQNAGVTYPQDYNLGAYHVKVQHQPIDNPEVVVLEISDQDSPLHINGEARMQANGEYQLDIRLRAEPDAPQDIVRVLPMLGAAQDDGSVHVQRRGTLNDFF